MIKIKILLVILLIIGLLVTACGTSGVREEGIRDKEQDKEQIIPLFKLDKNKITKV